MGRPREFDIDQALEAALRVVDDAAVHQERGAVLELPRDRLVGGERRVVLTLLVQAAAVLLTQIDDAALLVHAGSQRLLRAPALRIRKPGFPSRDAGRDLRRAEGRLRPASAVASHRHCRA